MNLTNGILVIDDSTLDKPYARAMELVTRHWSGKHHRVVMGINLISLLWTDGDAHWPCGFRIYAKEQDQRTKNDHFRVVLETSTQRGFQRELVAFDSWYLSPENLKQVRRLKWHWLSQMKSNRLVDPDGAGNRSIREVLISMQGFLV